MDVGLVKNVVQCLIAFLVACAATLSPMGPKRIGLPGAVTGALLAVCAYRSWSAGWACLAAVATLSGTDHRVRRFLLAALVAIGATTFMLHGPAFWLADANIVLLRCLVRATGLPVLGEHVVFEGQRIHMAAFQPWTAAIPLIALLAWIRPRGRKLAVALIATAVAAWLARLGIVLGVASLNRPEWALGPALEVLFIAIITAVMAFLSEPGTDHVAADGRALPVALVVIAAIAAWFALWPERTPRIRQVRVLIDDTHGAWETVQAPFDRSAYGRHSVYTYSLLRTWLQGRHDVEVATTGPLRPSGDVVIIKTPALAYSPSERAELERFVRRGGGLLAIGDHTDLFNTSSHINEVLAFTGLHLRSDAVIPLSGITRSERPQWWNATAILPAGAAWESQTPASIALRSPRARPLILDTNVLGEAAEYSNDRNFGDLKPSSDDRPPPLVVAAERQIGRGRVVLIGDSTPWSNFSFHAPGNKELFDSALRFAATPMPSWRTWVALLVAVIALVAAVSVDSNRMATVMVGFATYATLGALATASASPATTPPHSIGSRRSAVVDAALGPVNWDADIRTSSLSERDVFSAFMTWMSRHGVDPEVLTTGAYEDIRRPVLILNPSGRVTPATMAEMDAYVREGGRLLVLDDPLQRPGGSGATLLLAFGIAYRPQVVESPIQRASGPILPNVIWALPLTLLDTTRAQPGEVVARRTQLAFSLRGVDPLWVDREGLVIYGTRPVGRGEVQVFIRSSVFSQLVMGDLWGGIEPGPDKTAIYELEYALLDRLVPPVPTNPLMREFGME